MPRLESQSKGFEIIMPAFSLAPPIGTGIALDYWNPPLPPELLWDGDALPNEKGWMSANLKASKIAAQQEEAHYPAIAGANVIMSVEKVVRVLHVGSLAVRLSVFQRKEFRETRPIFRVIEGTEDDIPLAT